MAERWIDLLDPSPVELRERAPATLEESALELLERRPAHEDEPRPTFRGHGRYVFGVIVVAVAVRNEDCVYYQEIDFVLTHELLLTVRKSPADGRAPYDVSAVREAAREDDEPGMIVYRIVDDVAERYLDLIDDLDAEIDELEDHVEDAPAAVTRARLSDLRHDLLHIRRNLAPMRDAVRRVVDNVVEVDKGNDVFPHDVEIAFNSAYDKLLRAMDGLEISRDLIASVRDYLQAKIANDQNEVMKRLTAIASILLVPTLIVGIYGQNFDHMPELHWYFGYGFSWAVILATVIGQYVYFKRKDWL